MQSFDSECQTYGFAGGGGQILDFAIDSCIGLTTCSANSLISLLLYMPIRDFWSSLVSARQTVTQHIKTISDRNQSWNQSTQLQYCELTDWLTYLINNKFEGLSIADGVLGQVGLDTTFFGQHAVRLRTNVITRARTYIVHLNRYHLNTPCTRHRCSCSTLEYRAYNTNKVICMGRGPRRGIVAHVGREVPMVTMVRPKFAPKSTPSRGSIPKYPPHPWTCPTYDAKRYPNPIRRFSTMHWTDRRTDARTDRRTDRQIVHRKVWSL